MFLKTYRCLANIQRIKRNSQILLLFSDKKFSPFQKPKIINSPFGNKPTIPQSFLNQKISNPTPQSKAQESFSQKSTPFIQTKQNLKEQKQIKPTFEKAELDFDPFNFSKKDEIQLNTNPVEKNPEEKIQTANDVVMSKIGLNSYLTRIYYTTGWSLLLTLSSTALCMLIPGIGQASQALLITFSPIAYGCFYWANKMQPKYIEQKLQNEEIIYKTINSFDRLAVYGFGCISMGAAAAPLFLTIHQISANILPLSMGITVAMFGGASLISLMMRKDAMLGYKNVLMGSMVGLIGLNIFGIIAQKYAGYSLFAQTLMTMQSYIGIAVFNALLMYDTHVAIKRYEKGDADHLGMSIQILLDVWNLIIRIARQIAKSKLKDKNQK